MCMSVFHSRLSLGNRMMTVWTGACPVPVPVRVMWKWAGQDTTPSNTSSKSEKYSLQCQVCYYQIFAVYIAGNFNWEKISADFTTCSHLVILQNF